MNSIKCVVVGDGAVGKTCLLMSYSHNVFPAGYVPTVFDNYQVEVVIGGEPYQLGLFDTAGQEDYDQLRVLTYPRTDVFLVCFSVIKHESFENVSEKWIPEIRRHMPDAPILLVGTQSDLREDTKTMEQMQKKSRRPVPAVAANKKAADLKLVKFLECSALKHIGLKDVFDEAIIAALNPPEPQGKICPCVVS